MTSGPLTGNPHFSFDFPSYEDWLAVARQELDGADPIEKLIIRKGDLEILPFYAAQKETGPKPVLVPSQNPYHGARSWINAPKILASDARKANGVALSHLNAGAEGILFDCRSSDIDPTLLLNKISLSDCSVFFLLNGHSMKWCDDFRHYTENNFDINLVKGGIFWETTNANFVEIANAFSSWPQFYSMGIIVDNDEDPANEIAQALSRAVKLIDELSANEKAAQIILNQISFSISVGNDFFLEISKIKSLRNLWHQVRGAYEATPSKPLHIHAQSNAWIKDTFQPHGNMIKSTTSAMAAIAGGCDSLTIEAENNDNETMRRMATNVSSILREESHFSKVADPTAGSYYIDSLTNQLSEKAWNKFQSLMK